MVPIRLALSQEKEYRTLEQGSINDEGRELRLVKFKGLQRTTGYESMANNRESQPHLNQCILYKRVCSLPAWQAVIKQ